ncbi:MAG: hypothetical protein V1799_04855 [bacterium]
MIHPDEFYNPEDCPAPDRREMMWNRIASRFLPAKRGLFSVLDRRSFLYGAAAMIVLYLSLTGAYHTLRGMIDNSQPTVLKLDHAYQSAITEFERVLPAVANTQSQVEPILGQMKARKEQIRLLDDTIQMLRTEANGVDLSPTKRSRLRELYSMKLQILQQMIEQGEIEL